MAKGPRGGRNRVAAQQPTPAPSIRSATQPGTAGGSSAPGGGGGSGGPGGAQTVTQQQTTTTTTAKQQPQQPAQTVQQATPAPTMSPTYNQFASMTDDQKANIISQNIRQGVPAHLANNDFQKFLYNMNLNDKPDVVPDAQLKSMKGQDVFRTVNSVYDSANDIGYSAPQICRQVMGGKQTRVSDNGGSVYGRGIYFATSRGSSIGYGRFSNNIQKTAVMHGKLNSNAKIINYYTADANCRREMQSGSKLGRVLSQCDRDSRTSIYAMAKGYNVMDNGAGYMTVLSRSALTISDQLTAK